MSDHVNLNMLKDSQRLVAACMALGFRHKYKSLYIINNSLHLVIIDLHEPSLCFLMIEEHDVHKF